MPQRRRRAARHHAFQDGAELVERGAVAAGHHYRRAGLMLVDGMAVLLDRIDRVGG